MSFLAKLRQTTPENSSQGLRYTLLPNPDKHDTWLLMLNIVETDAVGASKHTPYRIQPAHLTYPPGFLHPQDISSLTALLAASPDWAQTACASCLPRDAVAWLSAIAERGQLFLRQRQERNSGWQECALRCKTITEPQFSWQTESDGNLRLLLTAPAGSQPLSHSQLMGFVSANHDLCLLADQLRYRIEPFCRQSIAPERVEAIRETLAPDLKLAAVPAYERVVMAGTCTPYLLAQSQHQGTRRQHFLELRSRIESDEICCDVPLLAADETWRIAVGQRVLEFSAAQQPELMAKLEPILLKLSFIRQANRFLLNDPEAWRTLFLQEPTLLAPLALSIKCARGFDFPYRVAQQIQLHARDDGAGRLQLDLTAQVPGQTISLMAVLEQLWQQGAGDYLELSLSNQQILLLPRTQLMALGEEFGDWFADGLKPVPLSQAYRLHKLAEYCTLPPANSDSARLHQVWQLPAQLQVEPSVINTPLRPYQWLGVYWLLHLHQCGLNGLLADDMGLGKTLQTITFLSLLKARGQLLGYALVVVPTSLIDNWRHEIERFSNNLRAQVVHGHKRQNSWENSQLADVVITSYGAFLQDQQQWQSAPPQWLILDEAQTIKNPRTKIRSALAHLNCSYKLCLTGTPVENHLGEVWSLLDFLMPGILGSWQGFKRYYQKPVEQDGNSARLQHLLARIAPLVMRRTKLQVAQDLPQKTEITQTIVLHETQSRLYENIKQQSWHQLQQQLAEEGNQGAQQLLVLSALLKLRQVCCDPRLLGQDIASAKTEYCLHMLQELVSEGRCVLVFSQFTSLLEILASHLQNANLRYLLLTGKTRHRADLVETFQRGEVPIFLISLKAGGTGLNLTQADTVIHFDPWWNQAAEAQASDRAHRLGQDKPVFVYKLIAQDTIEEKIAALQQSKAALSDAVNRNAQASARKFALNLQELIALWQ